MTTTNPEIETSVLNRLAEAGLDYGLKSAYPVPPKQKIQREQLPCAYGLFGGVYQPALVTRGQLSFGRVYIQRILIKPFDGSPDKPNEGNEAVLEVLEWTSKVHFYYHERPQLSTSKLAPLKGCKMIERTEDTGLVYRTAPGGAMYTALDVTLYILMAFKVQSVHIPYEDEV